MASDYGEVRAYFRAQASTWIDLGWSGSYMLQHLKDLYGKAYNVQKFYDDLREYQGMYKYQGLIENLSGVKNVPTSWMSEVTLRRNRKYRLIGEATYYDNTTGKEFSKMVSMYTDDRMSKDAWTWQFNDTKRVYQYQMEWDLMDVNWQVVQHNENWDY